MEIELRQHKDGSFILEVRQGSSKSEIDVTRVIHEIFLDKLKDLQARVRMEEKYRNWVVESAQTSTSAIATAYSRYGSLIERIKEINQLVTLAMDSWQQKKDLKTIMTRLSESVAQSSHFLQNDKTLQLLEELNKKNKG